MSLPKQSEFNEDYAIFFEGDLVSEADMVYRLALAESLDQDTAFENVMQVYQSLVSDLPMLINMDYGELRNRLLSICIQKLSNQKPTNSNSPKSKLDTTLAKFMKTLDPDDRILLAIAEIGGVPLGECASILNQDEVTIRRRIANIRQKIIAFNN